nr:Mitochondrial 28S ribosomal protein S32 (S32mt) [Hymenolepis microstoma]
MIPNKLSVIARSFASGFSSRASVVSKDGAMIICWHPKQDIPYENTKPIARDLESLKRPFSPLRVQFDHTSNPTIREVSDALCKSARSLRPSRTERAFSPYYWDDEILRKRL